MNSLVLESRNHAQDAKDRDFLLYLRRSGTVGTIDLRHADGGSEPQLLVPDQILGAFGELESAGSKGWMDSWAKINERITVFDVPL